MCIGGYLYAHCCKEKKYEKPKPVPLAGVVVSAVLTDFVAEVTVHQRYVNVESDPIEATYVFPLTEGASVSRFYAIVDGKKIEGKIKEKEKAKDIYDDAIASGNSAYLLEENEDNSFKTSIGNLPPNEEVVITIVYVTELVFNAGQLEFVLPTNTKAYPDGIVVPRFYVPSTTSLIKPLKPGPNVPPYGLKVDISLAMTSKINSVSSPSHPIKYTTGGDNTGMVTLANQEDAGVPLTKNFELLLSLAEPSKPILRVQGNVAMLAMYPDFKSAEDEDPITEMIFLVDRSGSMQGTKIARVKDTLHIFLRSLPLGTLFNIIGFGTQHVSLFSAGSKEYDDTTLQAATDHVNKITANLGGTNLLPPLQHILSTKPREGIPRQIFLLTDGEVGNTQECINFVRKYSDVSRVFAFGIEGASPELVQGIAKAGEGKAELIKGSGNIEAKVMAQLQRALQPALTNLKVDWGNLVTEQTPYKLPPVFNGSRVISYGYLSDKPRPGIVKFSAESLKGSYTFELQVTAEDLSPKTNFDFIPKLAARSMIRDLEESRSALHTKSVSDSAVEKKIIELSLQSGMLSKFTAFVAVNENNKAVEGSMQTRNVNALEKARKKSGPARYFSVSKSVSTPKSYQARDKSAPNLSTGGRGAGGPPLSLSSSPRSVARPAAAAASAPPPPAARLSVNSSDLLQSISRRSSSPSSSSSSLSSSSSSSSTVSSSTVSSSVSGVKSIVLHQKAAGNFVEEALGVVGSNIAKLRDNAPAEIKSLPQPLLDQVCGILRTKYANEADQWQLVEKKALAWVKKASKGTNDTLASFDWNALAACLAKL